MPYLTIIAQSMNLADSKKDPCQRFANDGSDNVHRLLEQKKNSNAQRDLPSTHPTHPRPRGNAFFLFILVLPTRVNQQHVLLTAVPFLADSPE